MSGFPSLQFCLPNRVKDVLEEEVVLNSHEALCHSPPFPFSFQCRLHVGGNNLPQITQGLLPFDHAGDLCARVKSMYRQPLDEVSTGTQCTNTTYHTA